MRTLLHPPKPRPGDRVAILLSPSFAATAVAIVLEEVSAYNPEAVICVGPPFGHTRPQWILPYGGEVTLDGQERRLVASYR